jgi:hypothetical protein
MEREIIMSIESYLERVAGGLEKKAKSLWNAMINYADQGVQYLKNFFTVLLPEEVAAIAPYAEEALGEAADAVPALVMGLIASGGNVAGSLTAYVTALAPVVLATAQKAEAAGLQVAGHAVVTAVQGAIANIAAAQVAPAPNAASTASAPGTAT